MHATSNLSPSIIPPRPASPQGSTQGPVETLSATVALHPPPSSQLLSSTSLDGAGTDPRMQGLSEGVDLHGATNFAANGPTTGLEGIAEPKSVQHDSSMDADALADTLTDTKTIPTETAKVLVADGVHNDQDNTSGTLPAVTADPISSVADLKDRPKRTGSRPRRRSSVSHPVTGPRQPRPRLTLVTSPEELSLKNAVASGLISSPTGVGRPTYTSKLKSTSPLTERSSPVPAGHRRHSKDLLLPHPEEIPESKTEPLRNFPRRASVILPPSGGSKRLGDRPALCHGFGSFGYLSPPMSLPRSKSYSAADIVGPSIPICTSTDESEDGHGPMSGSTGQSSAASPGLTKSLSVGKTRKKGITTRLRRLRHRRGSMLRDEIGEEGMEAALDSTAAGLTSGESDAEAMTTDPVIAPRVVTSMPSLRASTDPTGASSLAPPPQLASRSNTARSGKETISMAIAPAYSIPFGYGSMGAAPLNVMTRAGVNLVSYVFNPSASSGEPQRESSATRIKELLKRNVGLSSATPSSNAPSSTASPQSSSISAGNTPLGSFGPGASLPQTWATMPELYSGDEGGSSSGLFSVSRLTASARRKRDFIYNTFAGGSGAAGSGSGSAAGTVPQSEDENFKKLRNWSDTVNSNSGIAVNTIGRRDSVIRHHHYYHYIHQHYYRHSHRHRRASLSRRRRSTSIGESGKQSSNDVTRTDGIAGTTTRGNARHPYGAEVISERLKEARKANNDPNILVAQVDPLPLKFVSEFNTFLTKAQQGHSKAAPSISGLSGVSSIGVSGPVSGPGMGPSQRISSIGSSNISISSRHPRTSITPPQNKNMNVVAPEPADLLVPRNYLFRAYNNSKFKGHLILRIVRNQLEVGKLHPKLEPACEQYFREANIAYRTIERKAKLRRDQRKAEKSEYQLKLEAYQSHLQSPYTEPTPDLSAKSPHYSSSDEWEDEVDTKVVVRELEGWRDISEQTNPTENNARKGSFATIRSTSSEETVLSDTTTKGQEPSLSGLALGNRYSVVSEEDPQPHSPVEVTIVRELLSSTTVPSQASNEPMTIPRSPLSVPFSLNKGNRPSVASTLPPGLGRRRSNSDPTLTMNEPDEAFNEGPQAQPREAPIQRHSDQGNEAGAKKGLGSFSWIEIEQARQEQLYRELDNAYWYAVETDHWKETRQSLYGLELCLTELSRGVDYERYDALNRIEILNKNRDSAVFSITNLEKSSILWLESPSLKQKNEFMNYIDICLLSLRDASSPLLPALSGDIITLNNRPKFNQQASFGLFTMQDVTKRDKSCADKTEADLLLGVMTIRIKNMEEKISAAREVATRKMKHIEKCVHTLDELDDGSRRVLTTMQRSIESQEVQTVLQPSPSTGLNLAETVIQKLQDVNDRIIICTKIMAAARVNLNRLKYEIELERRSVRLFRQYKIAISVVTISIIVFLWTLYRFRHPGLTLASSSAFPSSTVIDVQQSSEDSRPLTFLAPLAEILPVDVIGPEPGTTEPVAESCVAPYLNS